MSTQNKTTLHTYKEWVIVPLVAKRKKGNRILVGLECTETGIRTYITQKNKLNSPEKLQIKKYNPKLRKYTLHKEVSKLK